jgi:hypothetical protein
LAFAISVERIRQKARGKALKSRAASLARFVRERRGMTQPPVGRGQRRVFFQAVAELRAFRRAYREALEQLRVGIRSVVFPQGTWGMCQGHRVECQLPHRAAPQSLAVTSK